MRDVEQADALAHRLVLLLDALVLDRHAPAGEGHEARAQGAVVVCKRRFVQWLRHSGGSLGSVRRRATGGRNGRYPVHDTP